MIIDRMLTRHKRERAQRNTVCVCVCVRERERETERGQGKWSNRQPKDQKKFLNQQVQ